jgi:anti-anti-sigma factor
MADKQSGQGSGEGLTRPLGSALSCVDRAVTEGTPDHVTGEGTSEADASHDSDAPAGCAASSRSERILFDNENFSIARRSDPVQLVLAGEIDFPGVPHLTAALLDAADGSGVLHVDLADVSFCDLAALRTIIGLGQHSEDQQPRRRARSVVLHNVPVHVEKVMRIVGWDTTPGLTIDTGGTSTQKPSHTPSGQPPCP